MLLKMFTKKKKWQYKNYFEYLILETCLQFGQQTHYRNNKFNKYIFSSKNKREILNLQEMRIMLFKLYRLVHTLCHTSINNRDKNVFPVKILFATTTRKYANIVKRTAEFCHMASYTNRWLNGYLTQREKHFAFLIIPDLTANYMIWKEAKLLNIPVIGLLNGNRHYWKYQIDYALLGNDKSSYIVNFFCQLIAILIKKELIILKHKTEIISSIKLNKQLRKNKSYKKKNEAWKLDDKKFLDLFLKETIVTRILTGNSFFKQHIIYKNYLINRKLKRKFIWISKYKNKWIKRKGQALSDSSFSFKKFVKRIAIYKTVNKKHIALPISLTQIYALNTYKKYLEDQNGEISGLNRQNNALIKLYVIGQKKYDWIKIGTSNEWYYYPKLLFWERWLHHKASKYRKKTYKLVMRRYYLFNNKISFIQQKNKLGKQRKSLSNKKNNVFF